MAYLHIANRIPPRILILSPFLTWIKAIKPIAAPQPTTDMIINARIDRNESRGRKIEKKESHSLRQYRVMERSRRTKNVQIIIIRVFRIDEQFSISFKGAVTRRVEGGVGENCALILEKKCLDLKCIQEKKLRYFPCKVFLSCIVDEMFIEIPLFQETSPPLKTFQLRPWIYKSR